MKLFNELKRRNVFRVAAAYIVLSWVLLQVGDVLFDTLELPGLWGKGLFALLILGFIPALVISWAYELTPDGLKRESEVLPDPAVSAQTGHRLNIATIAIVVIGVGFAIMNHVWLQSEAPERPLAEQAGPTPATAEASAASIAVLPFEDLSPEGDQRYFAHGIAEELLNVLAGVAALEVASRTSSFQYANRVASLPAIAEDLNVRHVLEGSVRKAGDTLRVTAQLIDARTDRHLWSETYDRPLTARNVFEIQDEIASAIVEELGSILGTGQSTPIRVEVSTENLDAYELYLAARALYLNRERLDQADAMLGRAVELDPEFVDAWSIRAAINVLLDEYGYVPAEQRPVVDARAREYADRTLAIDPDNPVALAAMSLMARTNAWSFGETADFEEILDDLDRALEIDPRNASALNWRGLTWAVLGRIDRAMADYEACLEAERFYTPCEHNLHYSMIALGQTDAAMERFYAVLDNGMMRIYGPYLPVLAAAGEEQLFKLITNRENLLTGWRRHDEYYQAMRNPDQDHSKLLADLERFVAERGLSYRDAGVLLIPLGATDRIPEVAVMWGPSYVRARRGGGFRNAVRLGFWEDYASQQPQTAASPASSAATGCYRPLQPGRPALGHDRAFCR
jgi:TolB-like protein